jgi:hypothetical protein
MYMKACRRAADQRTIGQMKARNKAHCEERKKREGQQTAQSRGIRTGPLLKGETRAKNSAQ